MKMRLRSITGIVASIAAAFLFVPTAQADVTQQADRTGIGIQAGLASFDNTSLVSTAAAVGGSSINQSNHGEQSSWQNDTALAQKGKYRIADSPILMDDGTAQASLIALDPLKAVAQLNGHMPLIAGFAPSSVPGGGGAPTAIAGAQA